MSKEIKHLFYSHSWITQLVIEAYIDKNKLSHRNITILSNRNFYECIDPRLKNRFVNIRKLRFPSWLHVVMSADKLRRFSKWFKNLTGDNEFVLYVPHFYPIEVKMMVQNKNCIAVYLIEEGELSYRPKDYINTLKNHNYDGLKKKYLNFFWSKKLSSAFKLQTIDSEVIIGTVQMFNEAFPYSRNKIVLQKEIENLVSNNIHFKNEVESILVLTPYVDTLKVDNDKYFESLKKIMTYISIQSEGKVHYKFHPNDSANVRNQTNKLAESFNNKFLLLPDDVSLEALLINSKPEIYSFFSSISLYAFLFQCKLNIMSEFISEIRPNTNVNGIDLNPYVIKTGSNK